MYPHVGAALIAASRRAVGLRGGAAAAPRPPRPPRPAARPAPRPAAAGAADAAGGGVGADSAAISGARSASVDQRNNSIVIGLVGAPAAALRTCSVSAGPSACTRLAPTMMAGPRTKDQDRTKDQGRTKDQAPRTKDLRLLPITVVRALRTSEPFDEPLELFVFEF